MGVVKMFFGKNCKQIASTTPQVWLVAGSYLGFAEKSFHSIAMTRTAGKFRVVMARGLESRGHLVFFCHYERSINCHRERHLCRVAICWQGDCWQLVRRLLQLFKLRNDKFRIVIANVVWR